MTGGATAFLRRALDHAFEAACWQVEHLTDDEYFWEPVAECWSVRERSAATWPHACGAGAWVFEWEGDEPAVPRVATIAWRLVHLAGWTDVYRDFTFGPGNLHWDAIEIPGTADDAVAWLQRSQRDFAAEVAQLRDDDLSALRSTHYGEVHRIDTLVWAIGAEHLHHGAEVGCLRDLHRGAPRAEWWPEMGDPTEA